MPRKKEAAWVALMLCGFFPAAASAQPRIGGTLPVHCRVSVNGKKELDLLRPAQRPYPVNASGRKFVVGFGLNDGILSVEVMDAGRSVSHGSWSSSASIAKAEAKLSKTGYLKLVSGDVGGADPVVEVSCVLKTGK